MSKLYEVLAVEPDLRKKAADALKALTGLFSQPGRFVGMTVTARAIDEGDPEIFPESTEMATTVNKELANIRKVVGAYLDVTVQKELTNTEAFAEVTLDGKSLFPRPLSATALLNLEARLAELEEVYKAIPTNDLSEHWDFDKDQGLYVSQVRKSTRNKKVPVVVTLAKATEQHPAQATLTQEEKPAYIIEKVMVSGLISPVQKQGYLDRLYKLSAAVKQARQRANAVELEEIVVADKIFAFVEGK